MKQLKDETPTNELSTEETARILGVTEQTVHNYRIQGDLQGIVRPKGKRKVYFFDRAAVERFKNTLLGDVEG